MRTTSCRWTTGLAACLVLLLAAEPRAQDALDEPLQLRRAGRADAALALVESQLAGGAQDDRLQGLRGLLLLDLGRDQEAEQLARELAGYAGAEFRVHGFLGRAALARGDTDAALALLQRALECKPDAIEPAATLVQAQIAAGKLKAAIARAEQLEALAPELGRKLGAQAWVAQARRHRERGEEVIPLAVDDYRKALEKQPHDLEIVRLLTDTLIDLSFVDDARQLIAERFAGTEQALDRHYFTGRCHAARLEHEAAETELRAVLALDPQHVPALIELSKLALDDGRASQAREWLELATRTEPRSSRAWMMLGQASEDLAQDEAAEAAYRQACELSASNLKAQYLLGRLLVRTGRDAEGQSLLQLAVADTR